MEKPLIVTAHAWIKLRERNIDREWHDQTIYHPDWVASDPRGQGIERRYRAIPAFRGRVLRVVCVETDSNIRVISVLFDRNARAPS